MFFAPLRKALEEKNEKKNDILKIEKAYLLAEKAHFGQKRKTGEDYITHPVAVAISLLEMGADETTLIVALLHDTVEDTALSLDAIRKEFGEEVAKLVDGLTKFEKNHFSERTDLDEKIETLRKWLFALQQDLRIAIIKIADRLDNIKTLDAFPNPQKRMRIAQETLEVYARICEWLCLLDIKQSLEQEALRYIISEKEYEDIRGKIRNKKEKTEEIAQSFQKMWEYRGENLQLTFSPWDISFQEEYFSSSPVSIACITKDGESCYHALSFLHGTWQSKKNSFEDFISTPKINEYQALHTTILLPEGGEVLVRIMTPEMLKYSKKGITTFCFEEQKEQTHVLPWIEKLSQLLILNKEKSLEFWNGLQSDLLEGFIVVYGPEGKTLSLPKKSTYLDAAFAFLGEKALFLDSVFVGKKPVTLQTQAEDGGHIHFTLSEKSTFSHEWILFVDNAVSMEIIKKALREKNQTEKEVLGKKLLQKEFDKNNLGFVEEVNEKAILISCKDLEIDSFSDLLKKIGEVYIFPEEVVSRIFPRKKRKNTKEDEKNEEKLICLVEKDDLSSFFDMIGDRVKQLSVHYTKKWKDILEIKSVLRLSPEERNILVHSIRRAPGMRIISIRQSEKSYWLFFIIISLLWGLDPVFAALMIKKNWFTPEELTILRFFSVTSFLGIIFLFQKLFFQKFILQKSLSFWDKRIFFISLSLFLVALLSYFSLKSISPSDYNINIALYGFFTVLLLGAHSKNFINIMLIIFIFFGYLLLCFQGSSDTLGRILLLLATGAFFVYSFLVNKYRHRENVLSRHLLFHFFTVVYCSIFCLLLLPFINLDNKNPWHYILGFAFAIIFTGMPHVLFLFSAQKIQNPIQTNFLQVLVTVIITILLDTMFLKINFYTAVSMFAILGSLLFLMKRLSTNGALNDSRVEEKRGIFS